MGLPLRTFGAIDCSKFCSDALQSLWSTDLWGAALRSVSIFAADPYFPEMHALRFRRPQDYLLLLLVMTAFFALGRTPCVATCFRCFCCWPARLISFHIQRDAWLVTLAAVAVLSQTLDDCATEEDRNLGSSICSAGCCLPLTVVAVVVLLIAAFAMRVPSDRESLLARVGEKFPVRACDYIRQNDLPNPLFNTYNWGSFLTWYLPEYPVAIDSRTDAYGEEITMAYFNVTSGLVPLNADPSLSKQGQFSWRLTPRWAKRLASCQVTAECISTTRLW